MTQSTSTADLIETSSRGPRLEWMDAMRGTAMLLLLAKSLARPLPIYYVRKFATIFWPYLVWMLIARALFIDTDLMPWWNWRSW